MTWFHWAQVGVAAVGAAIAFRRVRALLFEGNLEAGPFLEAVSRALARDPGAARRLCEVARPAWVAQLALAGIAEYEGSAPPGHLGEVAFDLRERATAGIRALRTIGRASSPLAFIGVMVELGLAFRGDHGLAALQRGLVEQIAMQNAVVGLSLGLVTSLCTFVAATTLHRSARLRLKELKQTCAIFDTAV